jgi:hypothetical protein
MNEIMAILYYVLSDHDNDPIFPPECIESDVFFLFSAVMTDLEDAFTTATMKTYITSKGNSMLKIIEK